MNIQFTNTCICNTIDQESKKKLRKIRWEFYKSLDEEIWMYNQKLRKRLRKFKECED